jgi:CTP:molybdopterin cytidylyltransferase MocA
MGAESAPVVVLAGGRGARLGTPKGLVLVHGAPWIERQLERLSECGRTRAIVVFGHAFEEHAAALPWVGAAFARPLPLLGLKVEVARNDAPERGPFSSLASGLSRVPAGGAAFVLPVDVPCPGQATWDALAAALVPPALAAAPTREGRGGHPVLLGAALIARLRAVPLDAADARLDLQLRALAPGELARVETEDVRAVTNLNTPEDWEALG